MMYEMPWPHCGERRKIPRKTNMSQWEHKLAKTLRGGTETIYRTETKQRPKIYQWDLAD